jgi:hypothetical protein
MLAVQVIDGKKTLIRNPNSFACDVMNDINQI